MSIWEKLGFGGYRGFSREAEQLLQQAVELAGSFGCSQADTGHLLLAMLQQEQGAAARFLNSRHISEQAVRRQLAENRRGPAQHLDRHAMAPDLRRTMDYALIGAQNAHVSRAEPEHLLCAMLEDDGCTAGLLLASMGVPLTEAVRECRQLSGQFVFPAQPRVSASMPRAGRASDKYCRDLTRRALDGELDPVFCRDAELDRMVEILCRRQKNNPCLVGEPGVGKTALAEGSIQCGFCIPGFIMTAVEILDRGVYYTDDQLRKLLSGHLCRCTGYENIFKAVKKTMLRRLGRLDDPFLNT